MIGIHGHIVIGENDYPRNRGGAEDVVLIGGVCELERCAAPSTPRNGSPVYRSVARAQVFRSDQLSRRYKGRVGRIYVLDCDKRGVLGSAFTGAHVFCAHRNCEDAQRDLEGSDKNNGRNALVCL